MPQEKKEEKETYLQRIKMNTLRLKDPRDLVPTHLRPCCPASFGGDLPTAHETHLDEEARQARFSVFFTFSLRRGDDGLLRLGQEEGEARSGGRDVGREERVARLVAVRFRRREVLEGVEEEGEGLAV